MPGQGCVRRRRLIAQPAVRPRAGAGCRGGSRGLRARPQPASGPPGPARRRWPCRRRAARAPDRPVAAGARIGIEVWIGTGIGIGAWIGIGVWIGIGIGVRIGIGIGKRRVDIDDRVGHEDETRQAQPRGHSGVAGHHVGPQVHPDRADAGRPSRHELVGQPAMRGEGQVGVAAAEIDDTQRPAAPPSPERWRGRRRRPAGAGRRRPGDACRRRHRARRTADRPGRAAAASPGRGATAEGATFRREVRAVCTCAWPDFVTRSCTTRSTVSTCQLPNGWASSVSTTAPRVGRGVVAGGRRPAVGGDDLQPATGLQLHRPQLGALHLGVPAPPPTRRHGPDQQVDVKQQRPQPRQCLREILRHPPILAGLPGPLLNPPPLLKWRRVRAETGSHGFGRRRVHTGSGGGGFGRRRVRAEAGSGGGGFGRRRVQASTSAVDV